MASDLETNLINGGLPAAAAKILANAIANVATSRTDLGRRFDDATPTDQLREISADTRRYLLPNLDQPRDGAFRLSPRSPDGRYTPRDTRHTYDGSQPATASPTLATPSVAEGDYISSTPAVKDSVSQSKVGLKVVQRGGNHARLNPSTGAVESVPFLVESDQEQFIEAKFEERSDGTVLRLRLRNLEKLFTLTSSHPNLISATMAPNNSGGITLNIQLSNLLPVQALSGANIFAWDR